MQTFLKQKISSTSKEQKLILETDLSRELLSLRSPTRVDRIRVKTIDPLLSLSLPPPLVLNVCREKLSRYSFDTCTYTHTHTPLLPRSRRSGGFRARPEQRDSMPQCLRRRFYGLLQIPLEDFTSAALKRKRQKRVDGAGSTTRGFRHLGSENNSRV